MNTQAASLRAGKKRNGPLRVGLSGYATLGGKIKPRSDSQGPHTEGRGYAGRTLCVLQPSAYLRQWESQGTLFLHFFEVRLPRFFVIFRQGAGRRILAPEHREAGQKAGPEAWGGTGGRIRPEAF